MIACTPVTLELVAQLKVDAAALKKTARIKHAAALKSMAQRHGYRSWELLMAQAGPGRLVAREIRAAGLPTPQKPQPAIRLHDYQAKAAKALTDLPPSFPLL